MIYRIDETTSTNDEARDAKYRHGDIVWAERQTAGRGQRGHTWTSPEGENLTFSMVLEPRFLPVGEQFLLSEAVTLALTDTFAAYGIHNAPFSGLQIRHGCTVCLLLCLLHHASSFRRFALLL